MKGFLKGVTFFLLPLIVLGTGFDFLVSNKLKLSKVIARGEISVWNDILTGKASSKMIILGSSRAWVHFDPSIIESGMGLSCYNLGIDGHPFLLQYYRYEIFRKYNNEPEALLISLETNSLTRRKDLYNSDQFLPFLLTNSVDFKSKLLNFEGFINYDFEIPAVRYYGNAFVIKELFKGDKNQQGRIKGFQGQNKTWNNQLEIAKSKFKSLHVEIDREVLNLFNKFLTERKQKGVKVILVYSPEYKEGQEFVNNRKDIIRLYNEIASKHHIPFIDFSNDEISFKKQYFYNASHLNAQGAGLFTEKLVDILKNKHILQSTNN